MTTPKIEAVAWRYRDVDQFIDDDWRYLDLPPLRRYKEVQPLYPQQTVDALLAEVERLREDMLFVARKNNELAARAERAEAQAEANRRDAERYRFLAADHSLAWEEDLDAAIGGREGGGRV